uniref:Uncharacterized protein n=1 Tax=Tanacetum cinerariifolium TaxID=118510 RepID=A0A699GG30_TANCI|nr:hypothetical protein [Tanacetum cinerariifolium]
MEDIELRVVDGSRKVQHAQERVKDIVVRKRLVAPRFQATLVDIELVAVPLVQPQHERHVALFFGRNDVRRAVQVHIVFAQRFAVVGEIHHRGIDAVLGAGSPQQLVAGAHGAKTLEGRRIPLPVRRTMAALLVQHDHQILAGVADNLRQALQQALVVALFLVAERIAGFRLRQVFVGHAVARALAAGIVIAPQHGHAGVTEHIEQAFLRFGLVLRIVLARHARKQARYRDGRGSPARVDVAEVDQARLPRQQRVGVARITVERKIHGARRLSHHHDGDRTAFFIGPQVALHGVAAQRRHHQRPCPLMLAVGIAGLDHIGGRQQEPHLAVLAHGRRQGLEERHHQHAGRAQRQHDDDSIDQHTFAHAGKLHVNVVHGQRRQYAQQDHGEQQVPAQQFFGFMDVGFHDVLHHAGVDGNAVAVHEIAGAGREEKQRDQDGLEHVPETHHAQACIEHQRQHGKRAQVQRRIAQLQAAGGHDKGFPEAQVIGQHQPDCCGQRQLRRPQRELAQPRQQVDAQCRRQVQGKIVRYVHGGSIRKAQLENAAAAGTVAVMQFRAQVDADALHQSQAQAGAGRAIGAGWRRLVEHARPGGRRQAGPGILDHQRPALQAHDHLALQGVGTGIAHQVADGGNHQLARRRDGKVRAPGVMQGQRLAVHQRLAARTFFAGQQRQRHGRGFQLVGRTRQPQQHGDRIGRIARGPVDAFGRGLDRGTGRRLRHDHFRRAADHGERRAQFVADVAREKAFAVQHFRQLAGAGGKRAGQDAQFVGIILQRQIGVARLHGRGQAHDGPHHAVADERAEHQRGNQKARKAHCKHAVNHQLDFFIGAGVVDHHVLARRVEPAQDVQVDAVDRPRPGAARPRPPLLPGAHRPA